MWNGTSNLVIDHPHSIITKDHSCAVGMVTDMMRRDR
ncbi:hypothetical protein BSY17_1191 [Sphingobium sp. RAC03]|nr:hypothetical protein BSY17_1204 [Sphingobium sp. RAC03]AOF98398.1 hypothetical protein BSY17_1191 [Sphingobium sp. RAC03]